MCLKVYSEIIGQRLCGVQFLQDTQRPATNKRAMALIHEQLQGLYSVVLFNCLFGLFLIPRNQNKPSPTYPLFNPSCKKCPYFSKPPNPPKIPQSYIPKYL